MGLFTTDPVRSCPGRGAQFLPKILQRGSYAPVAAQGRANPARGPGSSPDEAKARSRASSTRYGEIRDIPLECSSGYGRRQAQSGRCHVAASPARSDLWTGMAGGRNPDIAIARRRRAGTRFRLIRATLTSISRFGGAGSAPLGLLIAPT